MPPAEKTQLPFRHILKKVMKERNMTLAEVAGIAGVTKATVHNWLSGTTPQNIPALSKLAENLKIPFHYLLLGKNETRSTEMVLSSAKETVVIEGLCRIKITKIETD